MSAPEDGNPAASSRAERLARVRPYAVEAIKTFIDRHSRYQWLVLGTFSQLNLGHFGRYALDCALLDKLQIPNATKDQLLKVRSSTPDHELIAQNTQQQRELWNVFFVAMWAEFEAAVDDIRVELLQKVPVLSEELLGEAIDIERPDKVGKNLRRRVGEARLPKFLTDLKTYELLGFSPAAPSVCETLAEANAIRNVLLHRRGIIDERAIEESLNLRGRASPVLLTGEEYMRYWSATWLWLQAYLGDLIEFDRRADNV